MAVNYVICIWQLQLAAAAGSTGMTWILQLRIMECEGGGCAPKKPTVEFQSPISPKIKFNLKNDPGIIYSREFKEFVSNLILRL